MMNVAANRGYDGWVSTCYATSQKRRPQRTWELWQHAVRFLNIQVRCQCRGLAKQALGWQNTTIPVQDVCRSRPFEGSMRPFEGSRPRTKPDGSIKHVRGPFFREPIRFPSLQEHPDVLRKATVDDRLKQDDIHLVPALAQTVNRSIHAVLGAVAPEVVDHEGDVHVMVPWAS